MDRRAFFYFDLPPVILADRCDLVHQFYDLPCTLVTGKRPGGQGRWLGKCAS